MNVPLKNSIAALIPELTEWRRDFHRHPELTYDLPRTSGLVAERLRAFGFDEIVEGVGKTGVLGVLHGAKGAAATRGPARSRPRRHGRSADRGGERRRTRLRLARTHARLRT